MKKSVIALIVSVFAAASLVGCSGKISNDIITINKYKGLEVKEVESVEVTDEDVDESIRSTMDVMGLSEEKEITDRPAQNGDVVTIDFVGKIDGVEFEGGAGKGYELGIGTNSFIDGFESGIIGHTIGEEFDLNLQFPDPYELNPDLAGVDVVFTVKLHAIQCTIYPELTDTLVTQLSSTATTVEEYKKQEKENLQASNDESVKSQLSQYVWQALIENCEVEEFPKEDMTEMLATIESQYSYIASVYGMEVSDLIQAQYGITQEKMAQNLLVQRYAIDLIAEKEGLILSVEEYEEGLAEYALQYGYDDPAEFEEVVGHDELERMIVQNRVGEWLIENCKQVEK